QVANVQYSYTILQFISPLMQTPVPPSSLLHFSVPHGVTANSSPIYQHFTSISPSISEIPSTLPALNNSPFVNNFVPTSPPMVSNGNFFQVPFQPPPVHNEFAGPNMKWKPPSQVPWLTFLGKNEEYKQFCMSLIHLMHFAECIHVLDRSVTGEM
ncbi:hypothetical protein HK096_007581, partial [Nowakowskiella sp. JEL0078]